jgi:hypothetical protein
VTKNVDVRPMSARIWPIHPNNPPRINTYAHFVADTRTLELVKIPSRVERRWFLNGTVRTVYSDFTDGSYVPHEPVFPMNLP